MTEPRTPFWMTKLDDAAIVTLQCEVATEMAKRINRREEPIKDYNDLIEQAADIIRLSGPRENITHSEWSKMVREWNARKLALKPDGLPVGDLTGIETRTTRYKAEDGRERAVVIWDDYEWLLKEAKRRE